MFERLRQRDDIFSQKNSPKGMSKLVDSPTKTEARRLVNKLFGETFTEGNDIIEEKDYRRIVNEGFAELQDRGQMMTIFDQHKVNN